MQVIYKIGEEWSNGCILLIYSFSDSRLSCLPALGMPGGLENKKDSTILNKAALKKQIKQLDVIKSKGKIIRTEDKSVPLK